MPEQTYPAKVVKVEYICDECGAGPMRKTGTAYPTAPTKYEHECETCGHTETFRKQYPRHEFRRADEPTQA